MIINLLSVENLIIVMFICVTAAALDYAAHREGLLIYSASTHICARLKDSVSG